MNVEEEVVAALEALDAKIVEDERTEKPARRKRTTAPEITDPLAALYAALAAAQAELPAVAKDAINPHFRNRFTSLDELINATRKVLNEHGLAIVQMPKRAADGMPVLRTIVTHAGGASLEDEMPLLPSKNDMQQLGAAITYARRYAWASACGVASELDDDGESTIERPREAPRLAATQPEQTGTSAKTQEREITPISFDRDRAFKAVKAIQRKLFEAGLPEDKWSENLWSAYGTSHVSDLTDEQLADLLKKLRDAEAKLR